ETQGFVCSRRPAGERGPPEPPSTEGYRARVAARERAEAQCRAALSPRLRRQFDSVLGLAQHYARVREEQLSQLTIGWPVVRRALRRLGESCVRRGVISRPEDIHFLERG